MELRHLRYFRAVAEHLHFGRAAARLAVAQPALSQQIKALETELGVRLLERDSRHVALTEAGRRLLVEAETVLSRLEAVRAELRDIGQGRRGTLRIAYTRSAPEGLSTRIVDTYRRRFPQVTLEINTGFTTRNIDELRAGTADVAFVRPPLYDADDLRCLVIGSEPLVVVLPRRHRLAKRRRVECRDLGAEPLVAGARNRGPGFYDSIHRQIWGGPAPRIAQVEPDEEHMFRAVARGNGVAIVTETRARTLNFPGVLVKHFGRPEPQAELGLAWMAGQRLPVLTHFVEVASAICAAPAGSPRRRSA